VQIFGAYLSDELMQEMTARGRRNDFICRPSGGDESVAMVGRVW
jgi:hypothetical protein